MSLSKENIHALTGEVWSSVLGLEIEPCEPQSAEKPRAHSITGFVHINGAWDGAVMLDCSIAMAKRAAHIIFNTPLDEVEIADIQDVLGELANMVGGNVKSFLPGPCSLSLPTVVEGCDYRLVVRESKLSCQASFDCDGEPVLVTVLERAEHTRRV